VKAVSLWVLAALVLGIVAGAFVRATGDPAALASLGFDDAARAGLASMHGALSAATAIIEPFGGLWLNALRMTVVPLIVALLVTGIGSVTNAAATGGLVLRSILLFTVLLLLAAGYGVAASNGVLALWPIDSESGALLIGSIGDHGAEGVRAPTFAEWLQGLAPFNPVRAAAEDAILPLVTFAVFLGFASTRLPEDQRTLLVGAFRALSEAMIVIVRWILLAAPLGVFALALGVGSRAGLGALDTLVQYVLIVTIVTASSAALAWLLAVTVGGQPIARFSAAAAPVWAIAASTQSSLASLPAMLDASLRGLRVPAHVADVTLPLAVAVFRFTSPVANLSVCFFVAHLYGIEPSALQVVSAVIVAYAVSVASVGLPGQVSFIASVGPICIALGVPTEILGILIAVEIIPDIFRTLGNVTADLAATSILSRGRHSIEVQK
jgi:Na+/H+-dicarboxylate symporter